MTSRLTRTLISLTLACAGTSAASAQTVAFKPELLKGDSFAYRLKTVLRVSQTVDSATTEQNVEHAATFTCTVDSVAGDGSANVSMTFDALSFSIAAEGIAENFSWAHNGGDRPTAEMGEGINASGFALAGSELSFTVSPTGDVSPVQGLDAFIATIDASSASDVAFIGAFTPERLAEMIEPMFDADGGAAEPRDKGDRWSETERISLGPIGDVAITRDYSYLVREQGKANVIGSLSVKLDKPEATSDASPSVRLNGVTGATVIQWDIQSNTLERYAKTEQIDKDDQEQGDHDFRS